MTLYIRRGRKELDEEIGRMMLDMSTVDTDSPEYTVRLTHLERLNKLKTDNRHMSVSPDTMVTVIGSLMGIVIIVAYEQKHVMTSKGLTFVPKMQRT